MLYELLSIASIFILGIIVSVDDIKKGKIYNKYILLAIIAGLLLHYGNFLMMFLNNSLEIGMVIGIIINFCITVLVGYGLWHFNLWSAGDGKLFIAFSLLIPMSFYERGYVPFFPSFTLLFNTFIPFGMVLIMRSLKLKNLKKSKNVIKKEFDISKMIFTFLGVIGLNLAVNRYFSLNIILQYLMSLLVLILIRMNFEKYYKYITTAIFLFSIIFLQININALLSSMILFSLYYLFRILIISITEGDAVYTVSTTNIKKGMILKKPIKVNGKLIRPSMKGLDEKERRMIRYSELGNVEVLNTTHFAIYMFAGSILVILCNGNLLSFLLEKFLL